MASHDLARGKYWTPNHKVGFRWVAPIDFRPRKRHIRSAASKQHKCLAKYAGIRVPSQPIPMKSPSAHDPGALKSAPWSVGSRPWTVFRAHDTRDTASRIMDHAPWFRGPGGGFSSQLRKHHTNKLDNQVVIRRMYSKTESQIGRDVIQVSKQWAS